MLSFLFRIIFLVVLFSRTALAEDLPSLNILAPVSLSELVSDIAREYSRNMGVSVMASFGTSDYTKSVISDGGKVDVVITNDPILVRDMKNQGLMDVSTLTPLFGDALVVFSPIYRGNLVAIRDIENDNGSSASSLPALDSYSGDEVSKVLSFVKNAHRLNTIRTYADVRNLLLCRPIVIGEMEKTQIGRLATQVVRNLLLPELRGDGVSYGQNSRDVLLAASKSNAVAIGFRSDAFNLGFSGDVANFKVDDVDPKLHSPVIFQAFVVAGNDMDKARSLLNFMKSPTAADIIKRHGFELTQ